MPLGGVEDSKMSGYEPPLEDDDFLRQVYRVCQK